MRRDPALVRFARGTQHPEATDEPVERPTQPLVRGSDRQGAAWRTPPGRPVVRPAPMTLPPEELSEEIVPPPKPTLTGRPPTQPPAKEAPRLAPAPRTTRTTTRVATPELPGFGEYLVTTGILTRDRLRAAEAYQRSMKVQLSTAIVTLGLATPQRIEWAAVAHQSELARERRPH
jgi:hypothetical protein